MNWHHYFILACMGVCLAFCIYHVIRLIRLGKPSDYSPPAGVVTEAVVYSFTGAMNPAKKESAFLHLPTYSAGILYHLGTFLSLLLLLLFLSGMILPIEIRYPLMFALLASVISGTGILIKRFIKKGLRNLSSPDDFMANILVTIFQVMTILMLIRGEMFPGYCILTGVLMLYFPLGKLKHAIYFFAARYHLGYFFGWRGVWPPKQT